MSTINTMIRKQVNKQIAHSLPRGQTLSVVSSETPRDSGVRSASLFLQKDQEEVDRRLESYQTGS